MRLCSVVLLPFSCAVLSGCLAVPIVRPAGKRELSIGSLPGDTEEVQVSTDDGVTLRGLFVPAGKGAPVILHLLPSQTSVTTGLGGGIFVLDLDAFLLKLHDKGYASLVIDYRGVGASDGNRSPGHLPDDAWAMWREAVRRTGGRPGDVILRAGSLGTLPAASLLDGGAAPRGVVLIAPIRAETIAWHAPRQRKGAFLGTLISLFLRRPVDVDLVSVLRRTPVPVLVLLPGTDEFLPDDEMAMIVEAGTANGKRVHRLEGSHLDLILRSHGYKVGGSSGHLSPQILEPEEEFLDEIRTTR